MTKKKYVGCVCVFNTIQTMSVLDLMILYNTTMNETFFKGNRTVDDDVAKEDI